MPSFPSFRSFAAAAPLVPFLLLALAAAPAWAGPTLPERKAGLWEMRTSLLADSGGQEVMASTQCVDAATDKALQEYGQSQPAMNRKFCKEQMRNEAGKMLVHTEVCKRSDTTMTRRTVVSGDFNNTFRIQTHTQYDPPPKTAPQRGERDDMVLEMRWLGACPAGMKPGDMAMTMPGGGSMKMNLRDLVATGQMARQITAQKAPGETRPGEVTLPDGTRLDVQAMQRMAAEMQKRAPATAAGK